MGGLDGWGGGGGVRHGLDWMGRGRVMRGHLRLLLSLEGGWKVASIVLPCVCLVTELVMGGSVGDGMAWCRSRMGGSLVVAT
jgi:hypothetical protein